MSSSFFNSSGLAAMISKIILSGRTSVLSAAAFNTSIDRCGDLPSSSARKAHISDGQAEAISVSVTSVLPPSFRLSNNVLTLL